MPHYIKNKDVEAETGGEPVSGTKNPGSLVEVEKEHIKKDIGIVERQPSRSSTDTGNSEADAVSKNQGIQDLMNRQAQC